MRVAPKSSDHLVSFFAMKTCSVCGSHDFDLQDGKYYCQECNTQTQETQEVAEDERVGVGVLGRAIASGTPHQSFTVENFEAWLSVEGFNIILKKQVEALINLGASGSLMHTVLQLWAKYLQKSEVAFVTNGEDWLPKLSTIPRYRDYEVISGSLMLSGSSESELNMPEYKMVWRNQRRMYYKLKRELKPVPRLKPFKKKKTTSESKEEEDFSKILEVTTDEEIKGPVNVDDPANLEENSEEADAEDVMEIFSEVARKKLEGMDDRKRSIYWNNRHKGVHADSLTLLHTISFCYAGILLNQDHITLSDILRWVCQCKIPYTAAWTVLPKSMLPQQKDYMIFQTNLLPNRNQIEFMMEKILKFVDIESIPLQPFEPTILRILAELNLPLILSKYAHQLVYEGPLILRKLFMEEWKVGQIMKSTSCGPCIRGNREFAIIVLCLMILKINFGLDGKQEFICSQAAKLANKGKKTYFVWDEWFDFARIKLKIIKAVCSAQLRPENSEPNICIDVDWFHQYYWNTVSNFKELEIKRINFKSNKKGGKKRKHRELFSNEESATSGDEIPRNLSEDQEDLVAVERRRYKSSRQEININLRKMIGNLSKDIVEFSASPSASSFPLSEISTRNTDENFTGLKVIKPNKKSQRIWILNRDDLENNFAQYYENTPTSFRTICNFVSTIYNCDCQELCDELSKMENVVYYQLRKTTIIKHVKNNTSV